jgi:hypothetical protein
MVKSNYPSYLSCVAGILSESASPLSVDSLVARIEARRPIGKGVRSAIYQAISKLYQAVPVAPGCYGWLSFLLREGWFRHPLNSIEIRKGYLLLDEMEHAVFFPEFFQSHEADTRTVRIEMLGGKTVNAQANIEQGTWALRLGLPFVEWIDELGGATHDDLLIWVKDAAAGEYGLRLQPREARQEDLIAERNRQLVQAAEDIVATDRKTRNSVPVWELAAALIGRGVYNHPIPPDDMHFVLHEYSRLRLYDDLGYAFEDQFSARRQARNRSNAEYTSRSAGVDVSELPPWAQSEMPWQSWNSDFEGVWPDTYIDDLEIEDEFDLDSEKTFWDLGDGRPAPGSFEDDSDVASEYCEGYQSYLSEFYTMESEQAPLSHMEFHLLEAELEMLVGLEQEFGYLMPEQEQRKDELAERLFIDLNYFYDDDLDQSDFDDPPYWDN